MKDYASDKNFVRRFRDAAYEIARKKMAEVDEGRATHPTIVPTGPRIATGGHFGGFFLWDTAFAALWARHTPEGMFPVLSSLDNLYALADADGFISKEYAPDGSCCVSPFHPMAFAPPLISWAEIELFRMGRTGLDRLRTVYPKLRRHHALCRERFRLADGLYMGDGLGCGMDDISRWPIGFPEDRVAEGGIPLTEDCMINDFFRDVWKRWLGRCATRYSWNRQMGWIDLSSQMAFDAANLAEMADALALPADAAELRAEADETRAAVNERCWDETRGFYFDRLEIGDGGIIPRYTAASFWVLISGVATGERAARAVSVFKDPARFNRPIPFPAVDAQDPEFAPEDLYWRGAVWPPTNYTLIRGLRAVGEEAFAEEAARRWYNANAALWEKTGTVWENLSCEQCDHVKNMSGPDFCGWSALAPVALPAEFGWI